MALESDKLYNIDSLLDKHALSRTINILKEAADSLNDIDSIDKLNSINESYKYLRRYFMTGTPDPTRSEMLQQLAEKLRNVRDRLLRESRRQSPEAYYATLRFLDLRVYDIDNLLKQYREVTAQLSLAELVGDIPETANRQRYDLLDTIFMYVMASFQNKHTSTAVRDAITNPDVDLNLKLQLAYALVLGLSAAYDSDKVELLLDMAMDDSLPTQVAAVAYIGTTVAFMAYANRIRTNPKISVKVEALADNPEYVARMRSVIKAIAGTRDTERVSNKMKDEVIPEIMKLRPDMLNKFKNISLDADPESLENNPDWKEMLDKSGITRKLEELTEMMNDGADLMMVTFSQLKKFPFFQHINNWFLPFDINNPELHISEDDRELLDKLTSVAPFICDSDKYSLALAIAQTPADHRRMMMSQFGAQFDQMSQELNDKLPDSSRPDFDREIVKRVRDLYRYIFLGRNTGCFYNIFKNRLDFMSFPVIGEKLIDEDFLSVMAEFYMKRGFYREALGLFEKLDELSVSDTSIWQKIGFCHQKNNNFKGARDAYMKSELLGDDSKWLVKKLAFVNRKLGDFANALEYYERLLTDDPDNVRLMLNAATAALETGHIDRALQLYYHADYLKVNDEEIKRAIAWGEMLAGHLDKAEKEYAIITSGTPKASDWLNAGHVAQLQGNYQKAADRYRNAARDGQENFEMAYTADIPVLRCLGADDESIYLLLDDILG